MTVPWAAANAALLELNEPGAPDDFNNVDDPGDTVWEGEAEAVLTRTRRTVFANGTNTPVESDVLIVRKPAPEIARAITGDQGEGMTVLVEDRRVEDDPRRARFRLVLAEHRGAGEGETARFELADERSA